MTSEEDSVEQVAAARKERLRALRTAQELLNAPGEKTSGGEEDKENGATADTEESMKFRNYVPHDKELQEAKLTPPILPKFEDPVATEPPQPKEDPFVNIAPKKPNWDLRRDVQRKLDKLERRSQKALYKLMEEQEKEKEKQSSGDDDQNGIEE